jgi:hypothetical protein
VTGSTQHDPSRDADWNALLHGALDDTLDEHARARFNAAIAADPARAREFARAAMLHDAIDRELSAAVATGRSTARRVIWIHRTRRALLAATILLAATLAIWFGIPASTAVAAESELARVIAASHAPELHSESGVGHSRDRSYVIHAIPADAPTSAASAIDGAQFFVRGANSYVLVRTGESGARVVTGSDGATAWIVPSRGAVRVSTDPLRFRGALPGSQRTVSFLDPRDGLTELAKSYDLAMRVPLVRSGESILEAVRKPSARGGPKRITITYDTKTAEIHRMLLENLPQAQGGPRSVELELVGNAPLDAAFFSHDFHHEPERQVIRER